MKLSRPAKFILLFLVCIALWAGITSPLWAQQAVQIVGPTTINTGQLIIGTSAQMVVPARNRNRVAINMLTASNCAFGKAGVSLADGFRLQPVLGAQVVVEASAAVYAICDASTTMTWMEVQ